MNIIDRHWSEHLSNMQYLRQGIHLRGMVGLDPLAAYKNEGFSIFEDLMLRSMWEEFSKLVFRAEIEVDPNQMEGAFAGNGGAPAALDYSGGTPDAQPSALQQVSAEGGAAVAAPPAGGGNGARCPRWSRPWSRTSARKTSAATTPAGADRARSSRSATGLSAPR